MDPVSRPAAFVAYSMYMDDNRVNISYVGTASLRNNFFAGNLIIVIKHCFWMMVIFWEIDQPRCY